MPTLDELGELAGAAARAEVAEVDIEPMLRRITVSTPVPAGRRLDLLRRRVVVVASAAAGAIAVLAVVALGSRDGHRSITPAGEVPLSSELQVTTASPVRTDDLMASVSTSEVARTATPSPTLTTAPSPSASAPATSTSPTESTAVDVSTRWPLHASPSGAVVPYVLPTIDLDGLTLRRRYESDEIISDSILSTPYVQSFVAADASSFVLIRSVAQPSGLNVTGSFTTIGPWQVSDRRMATGWVGIDLVAERGVVMLTGVGAVTRDDLLDVAAGLRRRADAAPGWDATVLPDSVAPFSESWQTFGPVKDLGWYTATGVLAGELEYGRFDPSSLGWSDQLRVITVGHRQVFTNESEQSPRMFWREPDGTIFLLGLNGRSAADAVALVESLTTVTQSQWLALPQPDPTTNDGCDSLFC